MKMQEMISEQPVESFSAACAPKMRLIFAQAVFTADKKTASLQNFIVLKERDEILFRGGSSEGG